MLLVIRVKVFINIPKSFGSALILNLKLCAVLWRLQKLRKTGKLVAVSI